MMGDPVLAGADQLAKNEPPHGPPSLWLLGQFALGAVLATHIVAPALPTIGHDLTATAHTVQMVVSIYIMGLAIGQLFYGPLAERFGERRTLFVGIGLFTLASVAAALVRDTPTLIAIRLVQSLGGAAGLVLARSIARQGVDARGATHRLALMNLLITLGPAIAPLIGSEITSLFGWRMMFMALALLGISNLLGTYRRIPAKDGHPLMMRVVIGNYLSLFVRPDFLGYSLAGACFTTSMYAIIGTAPFILSGRFGFPVEQVGAVIAIATAGIWLGSIAASKLIRFVPVETLLVIGAACVTSASYALLGTVVCGHLTVTLLIAEMAIFLFGVGISGPPAVALAMSVMPLATASGSGVYGAAQMAVGALCSFSAALAPDPAHGAAFTVASASTVGILTLAITRRTRRHLPG